MARLAMPAEPSSLTASKGNPGVQQRGVHILEVRNVARHDRQAVSDRRCSNHGVPLRAPTGNVKACTALCHHDIKSQDVTFETRKDLIIDPGSKDRTLSCVFASDSKRAQFDLQDQTAERKKRATGIASAHSTTFL